MADVMFEFIARNPPTALIVGGIMMLLFAAFSTGDIATFLSNTGWQLIFIGFILNVIWLYMRR